jgi:hypothetical protein
VQSSAPPGRLVDRSTLFQNETAIGIGLPYITYQHQYEDPVTGDSYNVPRDPWGNPYMIVTREGFIIDVATLFTGTPVSTSAAQVDPVDYINDPLGPLDATVFDRFTLLSFGPDGLPGDGTGAGIDGQLGGGDDLRLQLN